MKKYYDEGHGRKWHYKHHWKIFVFLIFVGVVVVVAYPMFSGGFSLTGTVVGISEDNNIFVSADLTIPELNLNGRFAKVVIEGGSDSFLYAGDQKFELGNSANNYIVLTNYNGKIFFNSDKILVLEGKAAEISINGISTTPKSGEIMKVSFSKEFDYSSLSLIEGPVIKQLGYVGSGVINLGGQKTTINLNEEEFLVRNFQGDLSVENGRFKLSGVFDKLDVFGENEISVE